MTENRLFHVKRYEHFEHFGSSEEPAYVWTKWYAACSSSSSLLSRPLCNLNIIIPIVHVSLTGTLDMNCNGTRYVACL